MLFRIAALLGRSVAQLMGELSADEFREWAAYYDIEPWGFPADAWCAGTVSATVANYAGRSRKRPDAKATDWVPKRRQGKRRKMTEQELRARMKSDIEKAKQNG